MNQDLVTDLSQKAYNICTEKFGVQLPNGQFVIKYNVTDMIEGKVRTKFAELIVKECIKVMKEYDSGAGEAYLFEDYLNDHFGIKDE